MRVKVLVLVGVTAGLAAFAAGLHPWWILVTAVSAPLMLVLAPRFVHGVVTGARTPGRAERPTETMSGTQFEDHIAAIARSCGVPVIMTPLSGDWGVDLIVGRRPDRLAIQCKRVSRPVGPGAVQEVVAGAPMQGCTRTMLVSNQQFTAAAHRLAELHGCELVGGSQLPHLRSIIRRLAGPG